MREYIPHDSKYSLPKQRYLELKAFCRQYPEWAKAVADMYGLKAVSYDSTRGSDPSDPTERTVEAIRKCRDKMEMVEKAAKLASFYDWQSILTNVTLGLSYEMMQKRGKPPSCGVNQFYEARRKFYYELDKLKD